MPRRVVSLPKPPDGDPYLMQLVRELERVLNENQAGTGYTGTAATRKRFTGDAHQKRVLDGIEQVVVATNAPGVGVVRLIAKLELDDPTADAVAIVRLRRGSVAGQIIDTARVTHRNASVLMADDTNRQAAIERPSGFVPPPATYTLTVEGDGTGADAVVRNVSLLAEAL